MRHKTVSPLGTIGRIEPLSNLGQIGTGAENLLARAQMDNLAIRLRLNLVEPIFKELDQFITDRVHRRAAQRQGRD
jgi:hypothetical protein